MLEEIKKNIGHFISAIIFFQLLPLIPLWFEYMHTGGISMDSYILCVSMYSFATGFASKKQWMLGISFLIGILLSGSYKAIIIKSKNALPFFDNSSAITYCLIAIFIMHLIERWQRHINGSEPFFLFNLNSETK
jgi:hypothetical protein